MQSPSNTHPELREELRRTVWDGVPRLSAFLAAYAPTQLPALPGRFPAFAALVQEPSPQPAALELSDAGLARPAAPAQVASAETTPSPAATSPLPTSAAPQESAAPALRSSSTCSSGVNPQRSTAQARADAEAAAHRTEPSPAAASLLLAGLTATACGIAAWAYFTLSADAAREAARRPAFMKTVELPAGRCLQPRQGEVLFITVNASGTSHERRAPLQVACQTVRGQEHAR